MILIMLGAPGTGKGTQAKMISAHYNIPHVSTGDLFRSEMASQTELGKLAKTFIDKGELVPDEVTVKMLTGRVAKADCTNGFILDGFPRTIPQAEALEKILKSPIGAVINVLLPEEEIVKRLSGRLTCRKCNKMHLPKTKKCDCGGELYVRSDDTPEVIKNRLKVYEQKTRPLVNYYLKKGLLKDVDGSGQKEDVFARIIRVLQ